MEILQFVQDLFTSPSSDWLGVTEAVRARKCLASLAKTRLDKLETFYSHGNLNESTESAFWLAANMVLGSCWHMTSPAVARVGIPKGPGKIAFHHAPGATVLYTRSGTFLQQPGTRSGNCQEAVDVTAEVQCFHSPYITIGLPRVAPSAAEMYDQTIHALLDVFNVLWSIYTSFLIYVFLTKARNNLQARPLRPRSWRDQTPNKTTLEIYAHQVWFRAGNHPCFRFLLGHEKPGNETFCPQLQENMDTRNSSLQVGLIQAAMIVTCGFLVGSYMKSFNIDYYNALLSMIPKFVA